ncbi:MULTISPECIES: GNAT family N-acetyltransferase [unclassified Mesorhizobium]|uniref:GNAT family N-acetyltransferase n=1 Tax=unclassified Mesorhizobium TaxID=325217 RepID=UPI000FCCDBB6|nr:MULTISPECIES: GNAT family N-acetyltransferase [unclassified Mesorhizobium]TGP22272.1 GNAT family N-acetyltransferase [Mesorhizobium sp. M1D.F.Ca.ET.231.01.1.1]TGP25555.1 GNAT family N-acetyltransferase [Mesorhizobium sp. M1D.F.Ca.ET.234.01.1.1]TGS38566.1 GNAT family N-acetyltransferase [Mesorhizobium sp. M1D.F.Ca.ET.184.01.1.1]TGS58523.1 GNAT family N-acetyltransferase [Mesorhizobium sp. M1D.F.Ca.ET.183.01.1.1]
MKSTLTTHTGFRFEVRRARAEDEPIVAEFFTHVTPQDLRFRFLGSVKDVSHERLVAMTRSDDPHIHNFLAFSTEGMLIAVATLANDPADRRGEVAICIREDRKHLGVSWEFLGYIARYADEHGIETIESIESRENRAAIELERDMGFTVATDPDDPTLVLVRRKLGAKLPG